VDEGYETFFKGKLFTVFSASNYCGVTENKGAILVFKNSTFPTPKPIQYYSKSQELLRTISIPNVPIVVQDVICKIGDLLMKNHEQLRDHWDNVADQRGNADDDFTISRVEWNSGLSEVIKVQVPWLTISKYLPGMKESVSADGKSINYDKFLLFYSPYHLFKKRMALQMMSNVSNKKETPQEDPRVEEAMEKMYLAIYKNRYQLESLFRWFDEDGSGCLSLQEFIRGIRCLESLELFPLGPDGKGVPDEIIKMVLAKIDKNHDGEIAYDEVRHPFLRATY
jgi:Ca2+-binding EF-hand superfamily protein